MTPVADEESLAAMVTLLTDNIEHLGAREMNVAIRKGKAALKPPAQDDADEAECTKGRMLRSVGQVAGLAEWQLLVDEEAEAISRSTAVAARIAALRAPVGGPGAPVPGPVRTRSTRERPPYQPVSTARPAAAVPGR